MARWAKVKYKQLVELRDEVEKLRQAELQKLQKEMLRELAERLLQKAVKRTPSDSKNYPGLREGWSIGGIRNNNGCYEVEVYNNSQYAYSVEWGYLAEDRKSKIPGKFMLHISEEELRQDTDKIVESKLMKLLEKVLHDK